ncbi:MAG TPA: ABC transporter permease subunit [Acidobacteriota bacterium]|nr:ABC transporter permease subunit [Acidobacteriota bacterium]
MFRLIVEKELRDIIGSTKFAVTFLISALLILLAFYVGARNYQLSRAEYETAVSEDLRQMEGLTDWIQAEHSIFLPPQPLGALVTGVSNDIGRNIGLSSRGSLAAEDSRFNDDPIFAAFRFLDLEFVFKIVLSLFAILFVYNAVNGEKEQGTLRLTFTNSVPRDTYMLGKVTGSFLALGLPLLIPMLLGCLILVLMGVPLSADEWMRLGVVSLGGFLLLGAFLTLSLLVSTLTHRSSSAFLALLVAWIFAVLIIPRTSVLLAGRSVEVLSSDEMNYQKARLRAQMWEEDKGKMSEFSPTSGNAQDAVKEFNAYMAEVARARQERYEAAAGRLEEQRRNQEAVQQRLAFGLARISPVSCFSLAAMNLAGTSLDLKEEYLRQARAYRETYSRFISDKTGGMRRGGLILRVMSEDQEEPEPIDPHEIPPFQFQPPQLETALSSSLLDLGILALFNIVFFAGAFISFQRYDLR